MEDIRINLENLNDKEREQFMALVEKANKPQSKVWMPNMGDKYWFVNSEGEVEYEICKNCEFDAWCYVSGNCFPNKEDALFYREKLLVTAELQRFADEHNDEIDWEDKGSKKWSICFDYQLKELHITWEFVRHGAEIYFSSFEIAKEAIEIIGADRIKKYYLGVEE